MSKANTKANKQLLASLLNKMGLYPNVGEAKAWVDTLPRDDDILITMNRARTRGTPETQAHGHKLTKYGSIVKAILASGAPQVLADIGVRIRQLHTDRINFVPPPPQYEMAPAEQAQVINEDPADDGGRPDELRVDPPPLEEEKQPDSASQIPQPLGVEFQPLGIPEDIIRDRQARRIRETLPGATPDVVENMLNNTDEGIMAGQRENVAEDIYDEVKEGETTRGFASEANMIESQRQGLARFAPQIVPSQARALETSRTPPQSEVDAINKFLESIQPVEGQPIRQANSDQYARVRDEVKQMQSENPELAQRISTAANAMWQSARNATPEMINVIPWLALGVATFSAGRYVSKDSSINYKAVLGLLALVSKQGFKAPEALTNMFQNRLNRGIQDAGDAGDGGDDARPPDDQFEDQLDTGRADNVNTAQQPTRVRQGRLQLRLRQRFAPNIQPDQVAQPEMRQRILENIQNGLGQGVGIATIMKIYDSIIGNTKTDTKVPEDKKTSTETRKVNARPGKIQIQEEPVKLKFKEQMQPSVGDLRPSFKQLGTDEDTETPDQAVQEQFEFSNYQHVNSGFGNGKENPLHLQNVAWDNMVRFVNNFVPAVDRASKYALCKPQHMPIDAVIGSRAYQAKLNQKLMGDPDMLYNGAYDIDAVLRPDNLGIFNLDTPTIPFVRDVAPTTDFAEFKQSNNRDYPIGGTDRPSMPRTTYLDPRISGGLNFNTKRYDTQSSLELRPPPPRTIPAPPKPPAWTTVNCVETTNDRSFNPFSPAT